MLRATVGVLWAAALLAACGGDPAEPESEPTAAGACETNVVVTVTSTGETATLTDAAAVSLGGGAAYTMYVADFPLDLGQASLATDPDVEAGGHLATIAATVFQPEGAPGPIAAGTVVPAGTQTGELVFVATLQSDTEQYQNNSGLTGSLTMREVGPAVCVDVDYADDEKTIRGTLGSATQEVS